MKKVYLEKPVSLYELKKTYSDDVEFISDIATYPMVTGIVFEGPLHKAIKDKLHSKDMTKKINRLLELYKRRLFRQWDGHVEELLHKLNLPEVIHKADEENKDSDTRKAVIATIIASLGLSLSDSALDFYRKAYLLGKERGISISGEEFRAAINDEAANKLSNLADTNRDYLDGFMKDLNDKFNDTIDQDYASKEEAAKAIEQVAAGAEARLALYVTAILGALSFGITDGIREGQEEKEPGEPEVTGIIWATNHDDAVCEGCAANDGTFFTLEEFENEYQHNECLTRCRCAEVSEPTTAPAEHFARSARVKDLVKGGPGSGCNPEVGTCGRPAGTSTTDIKSLVNEHIKPAERLLVGESQTTQRKTFTPFKLPNGLKSDDVDGIHKELQAKGITGVRGRYKILYNPNKDEAIAFPFSKEHYDAFDEMVASKTIEGNIDVNWSRMGYSTEDNNPCVHLDYWGTSDDFDDAKYKNYNDTLWSIVNNKSFSDDVDFETWQLHGPTTKKSLGEWREMYNLNKGGPGSGCNPEVGHCGRPTENGADNDVTSVTNPITGQTVPGVEIEGQKKPVVHRPTEFKWGPKQDEDLRYARISRNLDENNPQHQEEINELRHKIEIRAIGDYVSSRRPVLSVYGTAVIGAETRLDAKRDFHSPEKFNLVDAFEHIPTDETAAQPGSPLDSLGLGLASHEAFQTYVKSNIKNFPEHLQKRMAKTLTRVELASNMSPNIGGQYFNPKSKIAQNIVRINAYGSDVKGVDMNAMITHEFAHALDYGMASDSADGITFSDTRTWKNAMSEGRPITTYAKRNQREYFAESVTSYLYTPTKLKKGNPKAFEVLDHLFKNNMDGFTLRKAQEIATDDNDVISDSFDDSVAQVIGMSLKEQNDMVEKGGPGSGCQGPNCGRPYEGGGVATEDTPKAPVVEEQSSPLQSKFDNFVDPKDVTSENEKDVQLIRNHINEVMARYDNETMNEYHTAVPVVSSGDLPKTMDLPFREKFKPQDSASRHAAASAVSKIFDEKRLNDPATADKDVMILAGISGAGKTHTIRSLEQHLENYALVKDTNLNNFEAAKKNINKALDAHHKAFVLYVERDPVESFTDGVFPRSLETKSKGRIIPIEGHLRNSMARDTIKQVAENYKNNPNVTIRAFANRTGEDVHEIKLDEIKPLPYTMDEARTKLTNFVKEKYESGQITKEVYDAFLAK